MRGQFCPVSGLPCRAWLPGEMFWTPGGDKLLSWAGCLSAGLENGLVPRHGEATPLPCVGSFVGVGQGNRLLLLVVKLGGPFGLPLLMATWLRFNFPISLYMYCRQTVSSLLNWKPRGQLFTHVSYRLSPRCHQGNEERSRSLERNTCLSVCGMSSS